MQIPILTYSKFNILMVFIMMSYLSFSQYTKDRYHIKDSISKYKISSYEIYDITDLGKDSILIEKLFFDKNGNLIKEYEPKYEISITYEYDTLQRLISYHTYCPKIQNEKVILIYDNELLIREITMDSLENIVETREYVYDGKKMILEHVANSYRSFDFNYNYDSTGLYVIKSSDAFTSKTEIERNKYGGIIYFKMTDPSSRVPPPVWFTYNKNLRIEQFHYVNERKIVVEKMIYDEHGQILEIQKCGGEYSSFPCYTMVRFYYEYF